MLLEDFLIVGAVIKAAMSDEATFINTNAKIDICF